jgi:hypothetical protein
VGWALPSSVEWTTASIGMQHDLSLSRFFINPETQYFSIIMIKFYLHLIDLSYYKALEHTVDCICNKKKVCVCICVYIYIYIYIYI